jgi:prepilin-type N-terminal cleavage/methylation domain-containing protein/prepilin-type processing-associated H-X9-DG protein
VVRRFDMSSPRRAFTLIELLVVIAIIGILAAMLFPVFARARESARKTQCLANVKNIAMAYQIYLTDYDRFPPTEHRQEVIDYFNFGCSKELRLAAANPYLKTPVILDEYIKSREVWRCPSAKVSKGAAFIFGQPNWLQYLRDNEGSWGVSAGWMGPCKGAYTTGWGGSVTDSCRQGLAVTDSGAVGGGFVQSIGIPKNPGMNPGQAPDPSQWVVCADAGVIMDLWSPVLTAYPEQCTLVCSPCSKDWANCPDTQSCGAPLQGLTDASFRKQWSRHMGGSNLGFMDGHAKWMTGESILADSGSPLKPGPLMIVQSDPPSTGSVGAYPISNGGVFPTSDCIAANPKASGVIGIR